MQKQPQSELDPMTPKTLIMIPAYNEEKMVGEVVKSTKALYPNSEIVVVDDGSHDKTVENAKEAGAHVVSLPFHCGGSIAIQTGYMISEMHDFDYTVKIDADGQHKPEDITRMLSPLIKDEVDITIGSRYLTITNNHESTIRNGGRVFSSTLVSSMRNVQVTDITCGMRAWNRKAIQTLFPVYMERGFIEDSVFWIVETLLATKKGLRLKEVPIEVLPRLHGKSKSFAPGKMLVYPVKLITTLLQESLR
jgi:glycosyltransferase involved in cell wall biosynthesis